MILMFFIGSISFLMIVNNFSILGGSLWGIPSNSGLGLASQFGTGTGLEPEPEWNQNRFETGTGLDPEPIWSQNRFGTGTGLEPELKSNRTVKNRRSVLLQFQGNV